MSGQLALTKENLGTEQTQNFEPPDVPAHLSAEEKEVWNKTVMLLRPLKVLECIDGAVLAAYCCSYVRWKTAEQEIQKQSQHSALNGLLAEGANGGLITNPLVNISRRSQSDMITYAAQLGMTPAARLRIQVDKPAPTKNPFECLKNGKKSKLVSKSDPVRQIGFEKK